jgi:hypothetical protein
MDWIKWIIVAGVAVIQILEMVRSDRSHKAEVAAKDAALAAKDSQIETLRDNLRETNPAFEERFKSNFKHAVQDLNS